MSGGQRPPSTGHCPVLKRVLLIDSAPTLPNRAEFGTLGTESFGSQGTPDFLTLN